jgi:hypothetical protein
MKKSNVCVTQYSGHGKPKAMDITNLHLTCSYSKAQARKECYRRYIGRQVQDAKDINQLQSAIKLLLKELL